jgi:diguanylate cyclase (GGDEF)-like protein
MNDLMLTKRFSLAAKLSLLTISLILAASIGICLFMIRTEITNYYAELLNHGETIADTTSKNCEFGVYTEDRASLSRVIEALSVDADIAYVSVMNRGMQALASRVFKKAGEIPALPFRDIGAAGGMVHEDFINRKDGQRYIELLVPVVSVTGAEFEDALFPGRAVRREPKVIGYLRLGLTQEGLRKRIRQLLLSTTLFTTVLLILGSGLTILLTRRITSPLMRLKAATQDISLGKFDSIIEIRTNDEISDLAGSFNHMRERLRTSRDEVEARTAELTEANTKLLEEIEGRKKAEEQLLHDAFYDALTDFPNRALFMDRLSHAISIAKRRKDFFFAVLFLDIDRFKVVNDSLGHIVGDQLLVAFSQRLSACLRPGDTVSRLGGDEFAVLLEDISGLGNALFIAERIEQELIRSFNVAGHEVFATASIGIALSAPTYEQPEQILRDADTAMYQAKARDRANHVVFEPGMHLYAVERLRLEMDLRRAVERREFIAYYQPILSLKANEVVGYEALARWQHPERGLLEPGDFIKIAEETGLIVAIDRLVLREACQTMHEWQQGYPERSAWFASVNLSNKQVAQPDLVEHVSGILKETGLAPHCLKLEITENVIIENPEATSAVFSQLRALGVKLYIDDFGTGYSSLSYLQRLPIDGLKIDRSFVWRMGEHGENQEIVKTIMTLAQDLNVDVIAEGVETKTQLRQINSLNCDHWQGFLFSKPVDCEQAKNLIQNKPSFKDAPGPEHSEIQKGKKE